MDTIDATLAEVVLSAIKNADLRDRDVAERIGLAYSTWRRKANGHTSFTYTELHRLAKLLKTRASKLVAEAEAADS
jgi:transcriptional regulator with XRE-family HTH domain